MYMASVERKSGIERDFESSDLVETGQIVPEAGFHAFESVEARDERHVQTAFTS